MSVDDKLRMALGTTDEPWEMVTDGALLEVTRRHRREVLLRRVAVAGAVAAVVVTAALLVGKPLGGDAAPDPVGPPSPPVVTASPPLGVTVLQGRWRTEPLDETMLRAAMESAGDEAFADPVMAGLPAPPFRLVWEVDRGIATLSAVVDHESTVYDQIALVVEDDEVTMSPRFAEGSTVHRFEITDDALRLTFVSTTEPAQHGIPGGVWQRLLYDRFSFDRR